MAGDGNKRVKPTKNTSEKKDCEAFWMKMTHLCTSEITVAFRPSKGGGAVAIQGDGGQRVGDHPHHGNRGLRRALEQRHRLDLTASARNQGEGFSRARGQDCWV